MNRLVGFDEKHKLPLKFCIDLASDRVAKLGKVLRVKLSVGDQLLAKVLDAKLLVDKLPVVFI